MPSRLDDLARFHQLLGRLAIRLGGKRTLSACNGRMAWPPRGVYFFFEDGERRSDTGPGPRVVRVGTHALTERSRTTLWRRLSQHQGVIRTGGGNHRASVFRLIVGNALMNRDPLLAVPTWGQRSSARREVRKYEHDLEVLVSEVIRRMPFLWLAVDDAAGPESERGYIERNAIALLSNWRREPLDPASESWLGHYCTRERVSASGLWNSNHVSEDHDAGFLRALERLICRAD